MNGIHRQLEVEGVVERSPLGGAQILPALPEVPKYLVHAARAGEPEAEAASKASLSTQMV